MRNMETSKPTLSWLRLALTVATCISVQAQPAARRKTIEPEAAGAVVFAVSRASGGEALIEPVVVVGSGGRLTAPVSAESDAAVLGRFVKNNYHPGQRLRLLFSGTDAGILTIKRSMQDSDCFRAGAAVELPTDARVAGTVMALATNAASLGRVNTTNARRSPNDTERAAAANLARAAFKQQGVRAALFARAQTLNLTAMDANGDGRAELIGSYLIKDEPNARHTLFLIITPQGNGYRTGLANYARLTDKDIMTGGDLNGVGQSGLLTELLIDQLDVDGDHAGEVFTRINTFEGVNYAIYRQRAGAWRKVYDFHGYHCAF